MFDLDIRIMGKKQSRHMLLFQTFKTHEEAISAVLKYVELVTNFMECDDMDVQFRSTVMSPDTVTLYRGESTMCAVFRILERKDHVRSIRKNNKDHPTSYQDRRDSLSMENRFVQERTVTS